MDKKRQQMSVKIIVFLLAFFLMFKNEAQAENKLSELHAQSAVLMDGTTGRILYGKEEKIARANASTTKILTCILALEHSSLDDVVTISEQAARQPKVHAGLQKEEMYFMEDLLYSLMLESHNDSAVAIAEHISGSVEAFSELMNRKAREIGCTTANFVTPNGLDGKNNKGKHGISAEDLGLIMRYCVYQSSKAKEFIKITQKRSHEFKEITGKQAIFCSNKNAMLDNMEGMISGKTGFTGEAGYCYVAAVEKNQKPFIVVLLGCGWPNNKNYKWMDTKNLINYGDSNYHLAKIERSKTLPRVDVNKGVPSDFVNIEVDDPMEYDLVLLGKEERLRKDMEIESMVEAPVKKGAVLGGIAYYIGDEKIGEEKLVSKDTVERRTYLWAFLKIYKYFVKL